MTKRYVQGAVAALLVIAALFAWYRQNVGKLPANQSPKEFRVIDKLEADGVPDLVFTKLEGGEIRLSELRGKIVILNFWASWCNPCVEEFPSMLKLVEAMKGEVIVVAVSTDDERKDIDTFTRAMGLPKPGFVVVWDEKKEAMKTFGVEKVPESFLISKEGKLIRKVLGIENWSSTSAIDYFQHLLGKTP
ncbi:MAG: TlpA disulfide reductase family protein [Bdellovibrionota bacterium]